MKLTNICSKYLVLCITIILHFLIMKINSKGKGKCKLLLDKMRHKTEYLNKRYDKSYSPTVIKDLLKNYVDHAYDNKKLLIKCLELISENGRKEDMRMKFWEVLEKFAMDIKVKLQITQVKEFIKNSDIETLVDGEFTSPSIKKISCSDYILECLKPDEILNKIENVDKMRITLQHEMGIYAKENKIKNMNFISSFASYNRDSSLKHANMFKSLNGNSR